LPPVQVIVKQEPAGASRKIPREWGRAKEIYRWRGPWRFLLLTVREVLRPLFYWHAYYIIQNEIRPPIPMPEGKGEFETSVYSGESDIPEATSVLTGIEDLTPEEITLRLRRGDAVAVPQVSGKAIGCLWMTFNSGLDLAFHTRWIVRPDEAVLYDTFVLPEWRGRGLHACMDVALNNWAYPRGIKRALASISALNNQSLGITKFPGKSKIMTLVLVKVPGIERTWKKASGARFEEYFQEVQGP
jgi:GNAT superfamily N-acetyltransferase